MNYRSTPSSLGLYQVDPKFTVQGLQGEPSTRAILKLLKPNQLVTMGLSQA